MTEYLQQIKKEILLHIDKSFDNYRETFKNLDKWSDDSFLRLSRFISRGKLIRGGLVAASYRALGKEETEKILSIAASIELLHAGFLMHDDVMDGDLLRRGEPAIHVAYRDMLYKKNCQHHVKNGESFAICLGNIAYFLAFDFIADSGFDSDTANKLNRTLNREAVITGFGQMNDIYIAASNMIPKEDSILNTYRMKTARYTFSLPLTLSAICAGLSDNTINKLIKIGEEIGTVFQLRDDELNIFGETEGTGKSVGSDISEGKKTLIFSMLIKNISDKEKKDVDALFSKKPVSKIEIETLRKIIIESGTLKSHRKLISEISLKTETMIEKLDLDISYKELLNSILKLSFERKY